MNNIRKGIISEVVSDFSTDGTFLEWSSQLWQVLDKMYPLPRGMIPIPEDKLLPPRYSVSLDTGNTTTDEQDSPPPNSFLCRVTQNERITAQGHWQDVRHIIFKAQDPSLSYEPGDIAVLYPKNPKEEVDIFLDTLHWTDKADIPLKITSNSTCLPSFLPS